MPILLLVWLGMDQDINKHKNKRSVSYQKKDGTIQKEGWAQEGCGHACPSFFWYDNERIRTLINMEIKSQCHAKRRMEHYPQKDGCGHAGPSFFWYCNEFLGNTDHIIYVFFWQVMSLCGGQAGGFFVWLSCSHPKLEGRPLHVGYIIWL